MKMETTDNFATICLQEKQHEDAPTKQTQTQML